MKRFALRAYPSTLLEVSSGRERSKFQIVLGRAVILAAVGTLALTAAVAQAGGHGWEGRRYVSEQRPNDLFYNYYVGPQPSGTAAGMYVSPLPVPANTGHTYTTYQPLMPHEMLYKHKRSYYSHHPGSGGTRTTVRYGTSGGVFQALSFGLYDNTVGGWLRNGNLNGYQRPTSSFGSF